MSEKLPASETDSTASEDHLSTIELVQGVPEPKYL